MTAGAASPPAPGHVPAQRNAPARQRAERRLPLATLACTCLLLLVSACGDGGDDGHVVLQFSGAVSGSLDADIGVDCFDPAERDDSFSVSVDSDDGAPVGGRQLSSLDFAAPEYDGPRQYDLGAALAGQTFDGQGLFLLFEEYQKAPFIWGDEQRSSGTVTIDPGERSGRLSLRGWENGDRLRVDVEGTFRCGEKKRRPT